MESRIHGDVYVRFGGERLETYRPKGRQGALRLACGGGKTLIMCCGAYEKKRLGLANKPMIIGLKANIHEIARTFCTAYPMAKVLYPGKEDFTPRKRSTIPVYCCSAEQAFRIPTDTEAASSFRQRSAYGSLSSPPVLTGSTLTQPP